MLVEIFLFSFFSFFTFFSSIFWKRKKKGEEGERGGIGKNGNAYGAFQLQSFQVGDMVGLELYGAGVEG